MSFLPHSAIVSAIFAAMTMPALAQPRAAGAGFASTQQTQVAPCGQSCGYGTADRQTRMEQRMQSLKTSLQLDASQQDAWNAYMDAVQQARANRGANREAFAAMSTPERIDAMQAMRAERQAQMEQRSEATKIFYAALTPEQQKIFDTETLRMHHRQGAKHNQWR